MYSDDVIIKIIKMFFFTQIIRCSLKNIIYSYLLTKRKWKLIRELLISYLNVYRHILFILFLSHLSWNLNSFNDSRSSLNLITNGLLEYVSGRKDIYFLSLHMRDMQRPRWWGACTQHHFGSLRTCSRCILEPMVRSWGFYTMADSEITWSPYPVRFLPGEETRLKNVVHKRRTG